MSLAILFHFLCAQHVSDINISIIRSLRLFCWITTLVILFLVRCVLEARCGWVGVVSVLQAEAQLCFSLQHGYHSNPATPKLQHTSNQEQYDECGACNTDTTRTQPHWNSNTHRTKKNTTNVVIQQNSHKLLMMDILMSETCWALKKWNKIACDIKLVFYSSTITMMHGPINIGCTKSCFIISLLYASTCFEHCYAHHQRSELYYTASGIVTPAGGHPVHRLRENCAPDGHLQIVTMPDAV